MRLLERDHLLEALAQAQRSAAAGRGGIALVSGEAGTGKTSLVARFAASLDEDAVAWGRCDALFTPRVLGPAYDIALRRGGTLLERFDTGASRAAIFAAFLGEMRRTPGAAVIFEDVHWADEASLDLLKYLGRRIAETCCLLILTFREEEVAQALRVILGELPREACIRVAPQPLSPAAVDELARAAGYAGDTRDLHAATNGNAFFVTEILASGEGGPLPAAVRDAVLARAARLSPQARDAADIVSTEPGGMEAWLAREAGATQAGLVECEERGILRSQGAVLRFRHEIARLALHEALGGARSRSLHLAVLGALREKGASPGHLARLAHHAEAAGEAAAVLDYAVAAARRASALGAHREAADHYARALRFAGGLADAERGELLDACAIECFSTSRFDAGIACREESVAIWRRLGDAEREGRSLARLAGLLVVSGRNAEGERAIRAALDLLEPLPPGPALAAVYRHHASLRMLDRDAEVAIADGHKALALAERFDDRETIVHMTNTIGAAMVVNDDPQGIAYLERSLDLARAWGIDSHIANAFSNLGSASGEVHCYREAREYLAEGIDYCRQHDLDSSRLYQQSWLALVELYLGRWTQAAEHAAAVLRHPTASAIARIMALLAVGRLRARRGDPGVWEALDEAIALSEGTQTLQRLAPVRAARAEAAWLAGEDGAAAREAAAAYDLALRKRHAWFVGELAYWQWKGGRALTVPDFAARPYALQAAGHWQEAVEEWRARGCPYEAARALAEGGNEARLEALRLFTELGARPAAERLRQTLRSAGVRRVPRGPRPGTRSDPHGLTARELQILGLVADGLTNAEIGARLHISGRTVDHHVSAILAKLGAATRREAAKIGRSHRFAGEGNAPA